MCLYVLSTGKSAFIIYFYSLKVFPASQRYFHFNQDRVLHTVNMFLQFREV